MAAPNIYDPRNYELRFNQALRGGQNYLIWADASVAQGNNPAGLNVAAPQGPLIQGTYLKDLAALIAGTVPGFPAGTVTALGPGTYYALFPMNGMAKPTIDLKISFSGGTLTSAAWSTYMDSQTQRQAFTGTGALTTGVLQTSSLATPNGEQFAVLQLVAGAGCSVTAITLAEYSGQRG